MGTLILLGMLASLGWGSTAQLCEYADEAKVQRNTYLQVSVLTSSSGLGFSMCDRKCSNVTGSLSYNYFRPDGKCECLDETSTTSPEAMVSREGWHHGDITTSNEVSNTSCTCEDGEACRLDMPALLRCPMKCTLPPPLVDSTVQVTSVTPTPAASYTCLEDFTFFGSSSHVTCTAGDAWEGLDGTCKRTTWRNLITSSPIPVPGPVGPGWRAILRFKLTTTSMSDINVTGANGIIWLVFSIRVDYNGMQYSVLNSYVGRWGQEQYLHNVPWTTGVTYDVTIAVDSTATSFKIYVDGALHGVRNSTGCRSVTMLETDVGSLDILQMVYP